MLFEMQNWFAHETIHLTFAFKGFKERQKPLFSFLLLPREEFMNWVADPKTAIGDEKILTKWIEMLASSP